MNSEPSNTNEKKNTIAAGCKKRRRSCKTSDEVPVKRGRKPNNRSRHNSDSDDTSEEHSAQGSTMISQSSYDRISRSPRPSKYNFFVDLGKSHFCYKKELFLYMQDVVSTTGQSVDSSFYMKYHNTNSLVYKVAFFVTQKFMPNSKNIVLW